MSEEKFCESCGMPMRTAQDFGAGRPDNPYCVHCCDETGQLKSYAEVLASMQAFARRMLGISEAEALKTAQEGMAKMPAWRNISKSNHATKQYE